MILDLFAGPGGWDEGLRSLGVTDVVGIENDAAACATRAAAGHATIRSDVAAYPTAPFAGKVAGLIASPPCQDFSLAGKRAGIDGDRGQLVAQVLRWARDLDPEWIACEQVPPVLPIWQAYAHELAGLGYKTWVGLLNAADYGVPQTRKRALLLATKGGLRVPEPTHGRDPHPSMFGPSLRPWVTMAQALAWDGEVYTGANSMVTGRTGSRAGDGDVQAYHRPTSKPAPVVDTKTGFAWVLRNRRDSPKWIEEHGDRPNRSVAEPAPTITGEAHRWPWERPSTTVCADSRIFKPEYCGGRKAMEAGLGNDPSQRAGTDAIKVTIHEAAVLQSFPVDYPWQGSKTKQFEQVGNAVPPRLAAAVCGALLGVDWQKAGAA